MVWRIETMRGVLGTVGSMFSQICHFNVKNLEFFLKILYPLCFFFLDFGPSYVCICHSALMVPFQMCNCTAPDALTHRERHRIYLGGHDAHVFQKEFHISDHRAVFQFLRHHFFIMFLYDLIFLWPSINLKKKENSKVNWNTWYYFCSIMKTICCKIFCRFKKTNKLNSFCKEIKETNCINVDMHDVRVHALMLATACDVRCHYKCNFFL